MAIMARRRRSWLVSGRRRRVGIDGRRRRGLDHASVLGAVESKGDGLASESEDDEVASDSGNRDRVRGWGMSDDERESIDKSLWI